MNHFNNYMTLAEANSMYNVLHVFGGEGIKEIKKDFDAFLDNKVSDALYKYTALGM